jgi:hypothetical protein
MALATVQNAAFFRVSNQGFIRETAFSLEEFSAGGSHGRLVVEEDLNV